jgi:hypothetical protein
MFCGTVPPVHDQTVLSESEQGHNADNVNALSLFPENGVVGNFVRLIGWSAFMVG